MVIGPGRKSIERYCFAQPDINRVMTNFTNVSERNGSIGSHSLQSKLSSFFLISLRFSILITQLASGHLLFGCSGYTRWQVYKSLLHTAHLDESFETGNSKHLHQSASQHNRIIITLYLTTMFNTPHSEEEDKEDEINQFPHSFDASTTQDSFKRRISRA